MSTWRASVEWRRDHRPDADELAELLARLGADHEPTVAHVHERTWVATLTLEAPTLRQAIDRAMRLVEQAAHAKATRIEVLTAREHERRLRDPVVA